MDDVMLSRSARTAHHSRAGAVKFFAGGILILGAILYFTFTTIQANSVYYYTLREFSAQRAQLIAQTVRINGPLDQSSIQFDQKNLVLSFNLIDGDVVQPVVYRGVVPDTLKSGESVVAEGRLDAKGVFQADTILVKCPSKYEKEGDGESRR